jgi:hypothetical protein
MPRARLANLLYVAAASFCLLFLACSSGPRKGGGDNGERPPQKSDYALVPLGGNSWVQSNTTNSTSDDSRITSYGIDGWIDQSKKFDIYFRANRAGDVKLALELDARNDCEIRVTALNTTTDLKIRAGNKQFVAIGDFTNSQPGYVKVTLEGLSRSGSMFPSPIYNLGVGGDLREYDIDFVKEGFSFGYGRRGPSDHLRYAFPPGRDIEWFYNEVTIEQGQDVIGSYFMANGFGQGYFGMQVNSTTERRMLFSVWSPYSTDNPNEIPSDQRVELLAKGDGVTTNDFGGEGSGGQSYLVYPWRAGVTYKFLNRVFPAGGNRTTYTAYFFDPDRGGWRLIASWSRPITNTWYTGCYSFLENFQTFSGQFTRRGYYGNQWARTREGEWVEITTATFTADDTARQRMRLDYQGGAVGSRFYLQNCGFFDDTTPINSVFNRAANGAPPDIDFSKL